MSYIYYFIKYKKVIRFNQTLPLINVKAIAITQYQQMKYDIIVL